ncbi:MAG: hypothetical protein KDA24_12040 [Deltaproteobacteria bacterium]|nr:hypothetical protein [Deltaproteobacteria bacterium]
MKTFRYLLKLGVIGAGVAAIGSGCAPFRDDAAPGVAGETRMAVLTSDDNGTWDVTIMDVSGNALHTVDANLAEPVGISYHPDDFFIVNTYNTLFRVDMDGETTPFNDEPIGTTYRTFVSEGGEVTVPGEYDATQLDPEGNVIDSLSLGTQYCWMDSGPSLDGGDNAAMLDVFGPTVAVWDTETDSFNPVATNVGYSANVLGADEGGNYYVGSTYDQGIWTIDDQGNTANLGNLTTLGIEAWGVKALEGISSNSVYALVDSSAGSTIVEVDTNGNLTEIVSSQGQVWMDVAVF